MNRSLSRRRFLRTSAVGVAALTGLSAAGRRASAEPTTRLKKALIGPPTEANLAAWKHAGFDGMESSNTVLEPAEAESLHAAAERLGMHIHSMLYGWANFNNEATIDAEIDEIAKRMRTLQHLGGDALLLVPCRIGGMPLPEPWEFQIEFDEATGRLERVVEGDNSDFAAYIEAHNHATECTTKAVRKLIPVAEQTGVTIALENVWNNLWVKPPLFRNLVASFDSPCVRAYFDIGNHVKYAPPQEWIRELGELIVRCHVKDFRMKPNGRPDSFVPIREGSVDWPLVRRELDALDRDELWMTIEGSGELSLEERSRRLDLIIAGQ